MVDAWIVRAAGCTAERWENSLLFGGLFGVKNASIADVEIRNIFWEFSQGTKTQGGGLQEIRRITSLSAVSYITPAKMDTASASLPAQVRIATNPDSFTTVGLYSSPGQLAGVRIGDGAAARPIWGARQGVGKYGAIFTSTRKQGDPTHVVLREGEGVAWLQAGAAAMHTQFGTMILRNQASGATYLVHLTNLPGGEDAGMIAVFNGSGSGIILELDLFESTDAGINTNDIGIFSEMNYIQSVPGYRLLRCSDLTDGELLIPKPYDTANTALPSGISFLRNPFVTPLEGKDQVAYSTETFFAGRSFPSTFRLYQTLGLLRGFGKNPLERIAPGTALFPFVLSPKRDMMTTRSGFSGYVVAPGESLVIAHNYRLIPTHHEFANGLVFDDMMMTFSNYNFAMEFAWASAPPSGTSVPTNPDVVFLS